MISVVIPAYNAEKYIDNCLNSLIQQTYMDLEIIVINDGSTDDTEKIILSYVKKDNRIKIISQSNKGVSVARNIGIENSNGEYLFFLDADDCVDKSTFAELINEAETRDSDMICCEIKDLYSSEIAKRISASSNSFYCNNINEIGEKLFYVRMGSAVGKLYKKDIINKYKLRFLEKINLAEDFVFVHEYCKYCNSLSKNTKAVYLVKNVNEESLSKKYVPNIEKIMVLQNRILKETFAIFPKYETEFYKNSMDIDVKACFFILKNMFLAGCDLSFAKKVNCLKSSEYINNTLKKIPIKDSRKLPKLKNDRIQYKIFSTKNVYIMLISYFFLEKAKKIKFRIRRYSGATK